MKRKFVNKSDWIRLKKFRDKTLKINNENFNGYIYGVIADEVNKKFITSHGDEDILILNDNYIWIQIVPTDKHYTVIIVFDENREIVQWYINITNMNGIDLDGRIFYDDMNLDVIVDSKGEILLANEDKLNESLNSNLITSEQYKSAYKEARDIMDNIKADGIEKLKKQSFKILRQIEF